MAILSQGCRRSSHPHEPDEDARISISLEIKVPPAMKGQVAYLESTKGDDMYYRMVAVLTSAEGKEVMRKEEVLSRTEYADGIMKMSFPRPAAPLPYTLSLWFDTSSAAGQGDCFDNSSLSGIRPMDSYQSTEVPFCGFATQSLDLREWSGAGNVKLTLPVQLENPLASFRLETSDVETFVRYFSDKIEKGEKYIVSVRYEHSFPGEFDAVNGVPSGFVENREFNRNMPVLFSKRQEIFSGWVFAGAGDTEISLTLTVFSSALTVVSRLSGIRIPLRRGMVTTLVGDLITNILTNSMDVDSVWDGEISIEV